MRWPIWDDSYGREQGSKGFTDEDSLGDARDYVQKRLRTGVSCPCCDLECTIRKRKFNSGMALTLRWLIEHYDGRNWVNVAEDATVPVRRNNEISRLARYGLAIEKKRENPTDKGTGMYRPTILGIQFAEGKATVPSHFFTYAKMVLGFTEEHITFAEALGEKFDRQELLES